MKDVIIVENFLFYIQLRLTTDFRGEENYVQKSEKGSSQEKSGRAIDLIFLTMNPLCYSLESFLYTSRCVFPHARQDIFCFPPLVPLSVSLSMGFNQDSLFYPFSLSTV